MSQPEHGTERSYIIGFMLSLLFTILPYELVVKHVATSTVLGGLILIVAVVQMVIQVVFFLHLGREQKPRWQLYFFAGTIVGIMTVVGGSIFIMQHLHHNMSPSDTATMLAQDEGISQLSGQTTGACQAVHTEHTITIHSGVATPAHTVAGRCDALVFETDDGSPSEIGFGSHRAHVPYAGQDDLPVSKGRGKMLILSTTGTYQFHDHLNPTMVGSFTVSP